MTVHSLNRITEDSTIELLRRLAMRTCTQIVVLSLGKLGATTRQAVVALAGLPQNIREQLEQHPIATLQFAVPADANAHFYDVTTAVIATKDEAHLGVHGLYVHSDGAVDMVLPRSGVSAIRTAFIPQHV